MMHLIRVVGGGVGAGGGRIRTRAVSGGREKHGSTMHNIWEMPAQAVSAMKNNRHSDDRE